MASATQRLSRELRDAQRAAAERGSERREIELSLDEEEGGEANLFRWRADIEGPRDSVYAGHRFILAFAVPPNYPLQPPKARCVTTIFHPNIHFKTGEICLDILKAQWSPAWTLDSVCRAVINLLAYPEPDSPLNCDAGNLLRAGDTRGFRSMATFYLETAT